MGFVRVTAPDKALELYNAGLLWEEWSGEENAGYPEAASGWNERALQFWCSSTNTRWKLYIYLED